MIYYANNGHEKLITVQAHIFKLILSFDLSKAHLNDGRQVDISLKYIIHVLP